MNYTIESIEIGHPVVVLVKENRHVLAI